MRPLEFERPLVHATIEDWERRDFAGYWADAGLAHHEIVRLDWTSKQLYVRAIAKAYGLMFAFESGTHEGDMVAALLRPPTTIRHVTSVEIDPDKFAACKRRFAGDDRVLLLGGSSVDALSRPGHRPGTHLWFLDGHANGPQDPDPNHFPLRDELRRLFAGVAKVGDVVVIDDCRVFGVGFWPTLDELTGIVGDRGVVGEIESDLLRIEVL